MDEEPPILHEELWLSTKSTTNLVLPGGLLRCGGLAETRQGVNAGERHERARCVPVGENCT